MRDQSLFQHILSNIQTRGCKMKGKRTLTGSLLVLLLLALAVGPGRAQGPEPEGDVSIQAALGTAFTYQGRLTDGGSPADGEYDLRFRLFNAASGGSQVGSTVTRGNVDVSDGVFTVQLDFGGGPFRGQARWLEIGVRPGASTGSYTPLTPRQELTAAPYALYARRIPLDGSGSATTASRSDHDHWGETWFGSDTGLTLEGGDIGLDASGSHRGVYGEATDDSGTTCGVHGKSESTSGRGVYGWASAYSGETYGVLGQSESTDGTGVYGWASAYSGETYGVYGESESTEGAGVVARGRDAGADLILAGNDDTTGGDDGRIHSDPDYSSSDIVLITNDAIRIDLDDDGDGEDADFEIYDRDNNRVFDVDDSGEVYADGAFHEGGADFAEMLPAVDGLEAGDLLAIGPDGQLVRTSHAHQSSVAGVYSTRPGFVGGAADDDDLSGQIPLAVVGVVPVKANAENGSIDPGDLLVASSTPGHAMKAGPDPRIGTVVGKALEGLESGAGVIRILVMLQ
jgi:hypothetical protein